MAGVPAIWENVRKGVTAKVNSSGIIIRTMFWSALALKTLLVAKGWPGSAILDKLIFAKVRDATGGRLRLCISGGAPMSAETQTFISMVIAMLINGYGLTETTG